MPAVDRRSDATGRDLLAAAAGARAAGTVIALGYIAGLVRGPIVAMAGGFALITFGRALLAGRGSDLLITASFAVMAGALGIGAFRWGSLDLAAVRGAQAVLGPTVIVGPTQASIAGWLAVCGCALALGVWIGAVVARRISIADGLDAALGALAIVTVFWGPALSGRGDHLAGELGGWAAAVAVVAGVVVGIAYLVGRVSQRLRAVVLAVALIAVLTAAGLIAGLA